MTERTKMNSILKFVLAVSIIIFIFLFSDNKVEASEERPPTMWTPTEGQHFELKATDINDLQLLGKQVIFELWGYNVDFARTGCKI